MIFLYIIKCYSKFALNLLIYGFKLKKKRNSILRLRQKSEHLSPFPVDSALYNGTNLME